MISVCIPVFNVDVRKLAETLSAQVEKLAQEGIPAEIILLDDGSEEKYRKLNRSLQAPPEGTIERGAIEKEAGDQIIHPRHPVSYHELDKNIGRAAIRNRFTEYAGFDYLLFLDCDLQISSADFLQKYADAITQYPESVICGGRLYRTEKPDYKYRLHWKYGSRKESQPVDIRKLNPNLSFMTTNFLIPASLLKEIGFEERLKGYGHEDSLFGYELSKRRKNIIHIHNPVIHDSLETNPEFVDKTTQAVRNLVYINQLLDNDPGFRESIKLIRAADKLKSMKLGGLIRVTSAITNPGASWALRNGCTSLKLLNLYKLNTYLREDMKNRKAVPQ